MRSVMRTKNRLTAKGIAAAVPGKYCDGGGLWFVKRPDGGGQWVLRFTIHGRRREMGLGPYPGVSLADARRKAEEANAKGRENVDPIKDRERQRKEAVRNLHLFEDVARDAFESRKAELKRDGKAGRWFSPLELHVLPKLGKMPVSEIDQMDIRDTLAPIWHTKAETARKAMDRIGICLKHAAALNLNVNLDATDKAKALLGKRRHKAQHIPAMSWQEVPDFYQSLNDGSIAHLALRLLILTGMRSEPIRFLREDQISGDVWTIPEEAVKGRLDAVREFRVPLSPEALRVIEQARAFAQNGYLFPGSGKKSEVISDNTMRKVMKSRGLEAVPHGFRSSLRVWLADCTDAPHQVAETVIAHSIGSAVVKAYLRTDFLEQRRALMNRWADFVTGKSSGEVVKLVVGQ